MAKKKSKKAVKKTAKAKSKKRPVAKKKKATPKKLKKKAVKKKAVARKKIVARKPVVKKKAAKKVVKKKTAPKKTVARKAAKPVVKKPAPRPVVKKKENPVKTPPVIQQEASHSEHRESFTPHATRLKAGDPAPYFSGIDQHGHTVSLDDFKDKTLVLYFYPKDDTEGCTAEACSLRDEYQHLTGEHYAVVGVSADNVDSHKNFSEKYHLPFPLIADTEMNIIKAYDVWGRKRLFDNIYDGIVRTTFIIKDNTIRRVITAVDTKNHGKQVMEA